MNTSKLDQGVNVDALSDAQKQAAQALGLAIVAAFAAFAPQPAAEAPREVEAVGLLSAPQLAKRLCVSVPTVNRFRVEGAPSHPVGARFKYDEQEVRVWLDARGKRPTQRTHAKVDRIEVADVLRAAGLRIVR